MDLLFLTFSLSHKRGEGRRKQETGETLLLNRVKMSTNTYFLLILLIYMIIIWGGFYKNVCEYVNDVLSHAHFLHT